MKTCSHCNKQVDDEAVYCIHCGFKVDSPKEVIIKEEFRKEIEPINNKYTVKNILTGLAAIMVYFVTMMGLSIPLELLGVDIENMNFNLKILYSLCWEIGILFLIVMIFFGPIKTMWKDFKKNNKFYFQKYFYLWFVMLALMVGTNIIVSTIVGRDTSANEQAINDLFSVAPIYIYFSTVIYAPIVEELVFRLGIRKLCKNKWIFIATSGLLFGLIHVIGSETLIEYLYIIPYAIPGFIFAYILAETDNIFNTVGLHFVHNGFMMVLQIIAYLFM